MKFRLNNVSGRTVKWFSVAIGGAIFSIPKVIQPGDSVEVTELDHTRYLDVCELYPKKPLIVEAVEFAGGDEWRTAIKHWPQQ